MRAHLLSIVILAAAGCSRSAPPVETHRLSPATASATVAPAPAPPPPPRPQLDGRAFPDKVLALTWDDGPDAGTLELAQALHDWHVSATFFVVDAWIPGLSEEPGQGEHVFETGASHLPILGELVKLGHRLGNHTKNHVILTDVLPAAVREQVGKHQETLDRWITNDLRLFRAPGGAWNEAASIALDADPALRRLVGPVRWDVDAKDWEGSLYCRSSKPERECERSAPGGESRVKAGVIAERYLAAIESAGHGIVLMHDRVGHVGSTYARSIAKIVVPELIKRGYVLAAPVLRFSPLAPHPEVQLGAPKGAEGLRGDLNGDGRADTCTWQKQGLSCALATASGFTTATTWLPEMDEAHGWSEADAASVQLVDINGDGRADVCAKRQGGVVCAFAP